ncbi:MAG: zinc-ribbon domain-containing protein [Gemmatimonadetes bacterium]|nr:zinc-ribbon domain-containing protein [Gemmatimonadota bacterium]
MSVHCTQCGAEGDGRFCASCGAPLQRLTCRECGKKLQPGSRFCTQCGTPTGGGSVRGSGAGAPIPAEVSKRAQASVWWVSGGLLGVLIVVVLVSELRSGTSSETPVAPTAVPPAAGAAGVDLSTMTSREAADRLFNRVMSAAERGDSTEVTLFLPMALQAYDLAQPLDVDGLFHLSLLQREAGQPEAALATAREGLQGSPEHLLNLAASAEAARALGDIETARESYAAMIDAWDREMAAGRPEYEEHSVLLPQLRDAGERFLAGAAP